MVKRAFQIFLLVLPRAGRRSYARSLPVLLNVLSNVDEAPMMMTAFRSREVANVSLSERAVPTMASPSILQRK